MQKELRHGYPCKQNRLSLACAPYSFSLGENKNGSNPNPSQPTDTKKPLITSGLSVGWDGWVRTIEMPESKSGALPLGYIPILLLLWYFSIF